MILAGESLDGHQLHERGWATVLGGEVEITTGSGESISGSVVVELAPNERHCATPTSNACLLLLCTPWPGVGHPGPMTLEAKASARHDAAEHDHTLNPCPLQNRRRLGASAAASFPCDAPQHLPASRWPVQSADRRRDLLPRERRPFRIATGAPAARGKRQLSWPATCAQAAAIELRT